MSELVPYYIVIVSITLVKFETWFLNTNTSLYKVSLLLGALLIGTVIRLVSCFTSLVNSVTVEDKERNSLTGVGPSNLLSLATM